MLPSALVSAWRNEFLTTKETKYTKGILDPRADLQRSVFVYIVTFVVKRFCNLFIF
jgi:hypothetical protein